MRKAGCTPHPAFLIPALIPVRATFAAAADDRPVAIARFVAMPDDERTTWLIENWDALVSGQLTLENLP